MKEITEKTLLKQGNKTFSPQESHGTIYWLDKSTISNEIVAQTSQRIQTIPTIDIQDNNQRLIAQGEEPIDFNYTVKDIEKAISLSRKQNSAGNIAFSNEEIIKIISYISIIEVDEQFNIIRII